MKRFEPLYDHGVGTLGNCGVEFVCFSGGGVKGVAFVGVIRALEERDVIGKINYWVGSSAGAIVAALAAIGMTSEEMTTHLTTTSFQRFFDIGGKDLSTSLWSRIVGWKSGIGDLITKWGMARGDEFASWLQDMLESKGMDRRITLYQLYIRTGKHLVVTATDVSRSATIVFSRTSHPNTPVVDVVKASMLYPFVFQPMRMQDGETSRLLIDGGLLDNFPLQVCDVVDTRVIGVNRRAIGFLLEPDPPQITTINNLLGYAITCVRALHSRLQTLQAQQPYFDCRVARIPTLGVETTDFDLSNEMAMTLIDSGYTHADSFLRTRVALDNMPANLFIPTTREPVPDNRIRDTQVYNTMT